MRKNPLTSPNWQRGQALVEYSLIFVLLGIALAVAITTTGPAIGNVFCNVVDNLAGQQSADVCGRNTVSLVGIGNETPFWATVTWVAANPQGETPFPTPLRAAPTSGAGAALLPTATDTFTPTNTFTLTNTFTPTFTATPSPGPSATPNDFAFSVPFVDQVDNPEYWRLSNGTWLDTAAVWNAEFWNDVTDEWSATNWRFTGSPNGTTTYTDSDLSFSWGAPWIPGSLSYPQGVGITDHDDWGARYTRTFSHPTTETLMLRVNLDPDDGMRVFVNGTKVLDIFSPTQSGSAPITLVGGTNTIVVEYLERFGTAGFNFSITDSRVNPDDTVDSCTWGRSNGGSVNNTNTPDWVFDENPTSDSWALSGTCFLELRGYVDVTGKVNPRLSFWDIWDFSTASSATVQLQVGRYVDTGGSPDRTQFNWQTINLRAPGTANYNWTRTEIDLLAYAAALSTNTLTFRFVIGSSGSFTPFRWYIDDIQIIEETAPSRTYTIRDQWNLDDRGQMRDFIYNSDTNKTIEDNPSLGAGNPRRWDLTNSRALSGTAWDLIGNYQPHTLGGPRNYVLEFAYPIDLTTSRVPTVPTTDNEGDAGIPILSFWMSHEIANNASLVLQYSNSPRVTGGLPLTLGTAANPDNWLDFPGSTLITATGTTPPRNQPTMTKWEIDLTQIPNYLTQPFRLRWVLIVPAGASAAQGVWIDEIRLERVNNSPFVNYPFYDDATVPSNLGTLWQPVGGRWGISGERGGVGGTSVAYTDRPNSSYAANDVQSLQMELQIDLLNDTRGVPGLVYINTTESPARPAAVHPVLSFWNWRDWNSASFHRFNVDLYVESLGTWTTVWTMNHTGGDNLEDNNTWERIEIDLPSALQQATGLTWATIQSNSSVTDDDIRIRFRFETGASTAEGIYVDGIRIEDRTTLTHRLWSPASGGDGFYEDSIDSSSPLTVPLNERWYLESDWGVATAGGSGARYIRSGNQALSDSPGSNYRNDMWANVLQLVPTIDLTNSPVGQPLRMYFWSRYRFNANDGVIVQIASETPASINHTYTTTSDKVGGWSAWTTVPVTDNRAAPITSIALGSSDSRNDGFQRHMVNLDSYRGQRIRIRILMRTDGSGTTEGMVIDDFSLTYGERQFPLPFFDDASSVNQWVTEGNTSPTGRRWGLAPNLSVGTGSVEASLGTNPWVGFYYDCGVPISGTTYSCNESGYQNAMRNNVRTATTPPVTTGSLVGPEFISDINFDFNVTPPLNGAAVAAPGGGWNSTFAARWERTVVLEPGKTYRLNAITDDGMRIILDDVSGTTVGATSALTSGGYTPNGGYILNEWFLQPPTLYQRSFTVTSTVPLTRKLIVEYFQAGGGSRAFVQIFSDTFSFTDSPNTPSGAGFTTVNSLPRANYTLTMDGYVDLSGTTTPSLVYQRLWTLQNNQRLRVEVSTNGGFNWTEIPSEALNNSGRMLPTFWETRVVSLAAYRQPNVRIRFRLDTLSTDSTNDGVYLANIDIR